MPTSVPNFNFLARLLSDIWRESQNKKVGAADLPRRPLAGKFLQGALAPVCMYKPAYQILTFLLSSFGDMKEVAK